MSVSRSTNVAREVAKDPTPVPASAIGAVQRVSASSPHERNATFLSYFAAPSPAMREMDAAWEEALALYGDEDSDAWVSALADGTHPLCRVQAPQEPAHAV